MVASHSPADGDEVDVKTNDGGVEDAINNSLDCRLAVASEPVNQEAKGKDGKVESGIVVMHIGDTGHNNKGKIVEEPSGNGVQRRIVDVVNLLLAEVAETSLPAENVPDNDEANHSKRSGGTPVDQRITKEEVLDNVVRPATHSETDMEEWPLPPLGSKVILLIGVGDQGIVGGHHGHVEMDKVVEEGGLVDTSFGGRDYQS